MKFDRRILFDYLQEKYHIAKMPKHMFMKLSNIFSGKLDGMTKPIPAEHLYDMWVRKEKYLNNIYINNITKGKKMDGVCHLNYDLAVLMAKYDNYLQWLEKNKNAEIVEKEIQETVTVTQKLYQTQSNNHETNDDSLSDILDELI